MLESATLVNISWDRKLPVKMSRSLGETSKGVFHTLHHISTRGDAEIYDGITYSEVVSKNAGRAHQIPL